MLRYSCILDDAHKHIGELLRLYNAQHHTPLDELALEQCIERAIHISNADVTFPLIVSWDEKIKAFCLVHFSRQERMRHLGALSFSILISNGECSVLKFLFDSVFLEAQKQGFLRRESSIIYGPVHNSILVSRGYRTFDGAPYTYQMPDNVSAICDWLAEAGGVKAKDLLEIVYNYDCRDILLTQVDERLLNRLIDINFEYVQKSEIFAQRQELADVYNISWQDNWGFSPVSADEIGMATDHVPNMIGMIARKNNRIIGFTMMQFIVDSSGKTGRAFLSGVLPKYRQHGLPVVLTSKLSAIAIDLGIQKFSISWMLEDNKMIVRTMQKFTQHGESQLRRYRIFAMTQKTQGKINELV